MKQQQSKKYILPEEVCVDVNWVSLIWASRATTRDSIITSFSSNCSKNVNEEQCGSWETDRRTNKHSSNIRANILVPTQDTEVMLVLW